MLHYCTRCGRIVINSKKTESYQCDFCKKDIPPVPEEFLENNKIFIKRELEQQFIKEYIESSPDFDPELQKARIQHNLNINNQLGRVNQMAKNQNSGKTKSNPHGVECPYCHSTNIKKITMTSKAVHAGIFGFLGAKKILSQYHCNKCGSDF